MEYIKQILKNFWTGRYGFISAFSVYIILIIGKIESNINIIFAGGLYLLFIHIITIYVIENHKNNLTNN